MHLRELTTRTFIFLSLSKVQQKPTETFDMANDHKWTNTLWYVLMPKTKPALVLIMMNLYIVDSFKRDGFYLNVSNNNSIPSVRQCSTIEEPSKRNAQFLEWLIFEPMNHHEPWFQTPFSISNMNSICFQFIKQANKPRWKNTIQFNYSSDNKEEEWRETIAFCQLKCWTS